MINTNSLMSAKSIFNVLSSEPETVRILDVRKSAEYSLCHIPSSRRMEIAEALEFLRLSNPHILFVVVTDDLNEEFDQFEFENVVFVEGGMQAWKNAGFPTEKSNERQNF